MSGAGLIFTIVSFLFFTIAVAVISTKVVRNSDNQNSVKGYFLAGNGLGGMFIAGSMLLTNLSAENLIGLSGQGYNANMSGMAWETTAVVSTIVTAFILLPKYLKSGYTTLPEFLEERFGTGVRRIVAVLFLLGYLVIGIPVALYAGSIAFNQIFNLTEIFGISDFWATTSVIIIVGIVGALYSIFGGLKAVAVSDTINGVISMVACLMIPFFGFLAIGDGNMFEGMAIMVQNAPEKMSAIGSSTDPVPFSTIFTGMILANMFYWGTNQVILQRAMGAKSLKEGQKGVLYSGILKLLVPLMMVIPGIIAFTLNPNLENGDYAFPYLVAEVLPWPLLGLFCAALFGAIISTYNSFLNSSATIFMLDIYKPIFNKNMKDEEVVRVAKIVGTIFAIFSISVAPFLNQIGEGLYTFARSFTGYYNIPVLTFVMCGMFIKFASSRGIKLALIWHLVFYSGFKMWFKLTGIPFLVSITEINFIHIYAISFAVMLLIIFVTGKVQGVNVEIKEMPVREDFDMTPWEHRKAFGIWATTLLIYMYVVFSPIGLAAAGGVNKTVIGISTLFVIVESVVLYIYSVKKAGARRENENPKVRA